MRKHNYTVTTIYANKIYHKSLFEHTGNNYLGDYSRFKTMHGWRKGTRPMKKIYKYNVNIKHDNW